MLLLLSTIVNNCQQLSIIVIIVINVRIVKMIKVGSPIFFYTWVPKKVLEASKSWWVRKEVIRWWLAQKDTHPKHPSETKAVGGGRWQRFCDTFLFGRHFETIGYTRHQNVNSWNFPFECGIYKVGQFSNLKSKSMICEFSSRLAMPSVPGWIPHALLICTFCSPWGRDGRPNIDIIILISLFVKIFASV